MRLIERLKAFAEESEIFDAPKDEILLALKKIIADYEQHGDWHPIRTEADLPKEEYISYLVQVKECPTAHDIQEWHEGMKKYWLEHFSAYQPLPEPYRPEEGEK
jgi:hypothetical protein